MRYYIYKLIFESGASYIGQHFEKYENDGYITSSSYFKNHKDDKLLKREILIELPDAETCSIFETICILADKANNPLNVNYNLGGWLQKPTFCGWNRGVPMSDCVKKKLSKKT